MRFLARHTLNHQIDPVKNFYEGLKKHGHNNINVYNLKDFQQGKHKGKKYDIGFCWGTRNMIELQKIVENVVIIENSYLNNIQSQKGKVWMSYGWNGLNGRADFCNQHSLNDRWNKHFNDGRLLDYSDGDYILIPLQIKNDMSIAGRGFQYQTIVNEIRKFTNLPIKIKQHPTADDQWGKILGKNISYINRFMPIKDAIKGAKVVVTINSNAGVDAVLAGKPVVALDKGSMVYDIASHDFSKLLVPNWPDRTQWCNDIAYAQWKPDEVIAGEAWEHLKQKLFTNA
jgi:hypothetical protein